MLPQVNVVIPTIGKDRMIIDLLQQLEEQDDEILRNIFVMDNGMPESTRRDCEMFKHVSVIRCHNLGIYEMWNKGVLKSMLVNPVDYIAIFNDDIILVADKFLTRLVEPLDTRDDVWASCGNYDQREFDHYYHRFPGTFKDGGFAGFCFAVKGEAYMMGLPLFETRYHWWYGDDDFVHEIEHAGKQAVMAQSAYMLHIDNGSKTIVQYTPEFNAKVAKDQEIYLKKWHSHT